MYLGMADDGKPLPTIPCSVRADRRPTRKSPFMRVAGNWSLEQSLLAHQDVCAQIVIVLSAMSTCDPGNIQDTIKAAKEANCRISIVGLAAEVHICRQIVEVALPGPSSQDPSNRPRSFLNRFFWRDRSNRKALRLGAALHPAALWKVFQSLSTRSSRHCV